MWHTGLVAPRHVGYSGTRARTRVPCIGRRILNHYATREALFKNFKIELPYDSAIPLQSIYKINHRDVMYSMVTINNTVLHI